MSVWGCVGKLGAGYMRHLDLPLAKKMMSEGRNLPGDAGGAYGAASAFNKWQRGFRPGGKSSWKDVAARRGTLYGAGATVGAIGGGMMERARRRRMMKQDDKNQPYGIGTRGRGFRRAMMADTETCLLYTSPS